VKFIVIFNFLLTKHIDILTNLRRNLATSKV